MNLAIPEHEAATIPTVLQLPLTNYNHEATSEAIGDDWPALRLGVVPPAAEFPVDVMPEPVADFIKAVSASIGCPPDFVGLPALVVAGAAIGRTVQLEMKVGYEVPSSLYALNIGGPSTGKSPALKNAVRPLWDADERLQLEYTEKVAKYKSDLYAYESADEDKKPEKPIKPIRQTAVVEDITAEALALQLTKNPRGLLVSRDEGSAWVKSFGQYKGGQGTDKQLFMSALFGTPIKVDRKGNADQPPIFISEPFLSVVGNLPPDILTVLQNGGQSDGFFEGYKVGRDATKRDSLTPRVYRDRTSPGITNPTHRIPEPPGLLARSQARILLG